MRNTSLFGQNNNIPIPDSHCDFIFASITSHYGILVGVGIIFLFILFFVRNIQQIMHLPFSKRMVVYGILSQIAYQSLFHLASNMSFIPPKGVSCPFLSYGGSEIFANIISIGTLFSITRKKL
jgi:rod shape determining protein RodA